MPKERVERNEEDLTRLYLTDIGRYPLLSRDDEVRLAQAIEHGNDARDSLERVQEPDGSTLSAARKRNLRRTARGGRSPGQRQTPNGLTPADLTGRRYPARRRPRRRG